MPYATQELKRKLRDVKRIEITLRFKGDVDAAEGKLVWDQFFSINRNQHNAKYSLKNLAVLDRRAFKEVLDEYFYTVYFRIYQESGLSMNNLYDPGLLNLLGLPAMATEDEIKNRFRSLAKKYHPDLGGNSQQFIELMETYEKLTRKKN